MGQDVRAFSVRENSSFMQRALNWVERTGNKLPHPVTIFLMLCLCVMAASAILAAMGTEVTNPANGKVYKAINLLSLSQLQTILGKIVPSFQSFPPLGLVLVVMIGAGLAEKTRFLEVAVKQVVSRVPRNMLTVVVFFIAILGVATGDAIFIIMPPLAGIIYLAAGRHPFIGMFAAFAAMSAALSGNVIVTVTDVLLSGFTIPAAQTIDKAYVTSPAMNLYFGIFSTLGLTAIGVWVTDRVIAPRFANVSLAGLHPATGLETSAEANGERTALKAASRWLLAYIGVIALLCFVPIHDLGEGYVAFFANKKGSLLSIDSYFLVGIIPIMTLLFFIPGYVFGKKTGQIKSSIDAIRLIGQSLGELGPYLLLAFGASQFIALFSQSNMGIILAIKGALFLKDVGLTGGPLFVSFILLCSFINLFIGSASAKWAMLAPIFVPMFMLLGYDPALTQMAYRIGDASTNSITPLFSYFPIMMGFMHKYDKNIGIGTLVTNMLPYTFAFAIVWGTLFTIFFNFGIPFGPR